MLPLPICRIYVEAGVTTAITTISRLNQKSKRGEAHTKKCKRINEAVATGSRAPRKKKNSQLWSIKRLRYEWLLLIDALNK